MDDVAAKATVEHDGIGFYRVRISVEGEAAFAGRGFEAAFDVLGDLDVEAVRRDCPSPPREPDTGAPAVWDVKVEAKGCIAAQVESIGLIKPDVTGEAVLDALRDLVGSDLGRVDAAALEEALREAEASIIRGED